MQDLIILVILVLIVGFALRKVVRDRKRGYTCSSCPQTGDKNCKC